MGLLGDLRGCIISSRHLWKALGSCWAVLFAWESSLSIPFTDALLNMTFNFLFDVRKHLQTVCMVTGGYGAVLFNLERVNFMNLSTAN